jgi:hypothetical protein
MIGCLVSWRQLVKKAAYLQDRKEAGKLATDLRILIVDDSEAERG